MNKTIKGTLKILLAYPHEDRHHAQDVELEPSSVVMLGNGKDQLVVIQGFYWYDAAQGHAVKVEPEAPQGSDYGAWGLYLKRGESLYALARKHARSAHDVIAAGMPYYGEALEKFILRIDSSKPVEAQSHGNQS